MINDVQMTNLAFMMTVPFNTVYEKKPQLNIIGLKNHKNNMKKAKTIKKGILSFKVYSG